MGKKEKGTKQSTVKGGEKEREGKKERGRKTKRTGGSKGKRKGRERDEGQWKGREGRREEGGEEAERGDEILQKQHGVLQAGGRRENAVLGALGDCVGHLNCQP